MSYFTLFLHTFYIILIIVRVEALLILRYNKENLQGVVLLHEKDP